VAPTVEELVKTSTLQTLPKYQSLEEYRRELGQRRVALEQSYANAVAGIPPYRGEPTELELAVGGLLAPSLAPNSPLMQAADKFGKFAVGVGAMLGRAVEVSLPFFEGLGTLVEAGGRWITEAQQKAARRAALADELLSSAYEASAGLGRGDPEPGLRFLRNRFGWRRLGVDHVAALWETLQADHNEMMVEMLPAPDPAGWLKSRVAFQMLRTRRERDPRDLFCQKRLTPDQEQRLRGAGHRQDEEEGLDPAIIVARKYDFRHQALERIAADGRAASRERAKVVLECLRLGLDPEDCRQLLDSGDAWRAFKPTARAEEEKLWKRFQQNYPKSSSNERYLHKGAN
jgi:hypothetical protein